MLCGLILFFLKLFAMSNVGGEQFLKKEDICMTLFHIPNDVFVSRIKYSFAKTNYRWFYSIYSIKTEACICYDGVQNRAFIFVQK